MNDNKDPRSNVTALPEAAPGPFSVLVPPDVLGLVLIGTRPDGSLYFSTENESLGDVALMLDLAKAKVMQMAMPPDDEGEPPLAG